jgi:FeS assembly SUF system protein
MSEHDTTLTDETVPRPRPMVLPSDVARENVTRDPDRTKDYLDTFLAQEPETVAADTPGGTVYDGVIDALKAIFDPEIPVNIYDLGLIYGVEITEGHADVTMTLTTPHCPVAESMPAEVELRVGAVPGVGSVNVSLVWDPPWDPQKMSDEAKLELGML